MSNDDWKEDLLGLTAQIAREQTDAAHLALLDANKGIVGKALLECLKHVREAVLHAKFSAYVEEADLRLTPEQGQMLISELRQRGFRVSSMRDPREAASEGGYVIAWDRKSQSRESGARLLENGRGALPT